MSTWKALPSRRSSVNGLRRYAAVLAASSALAACSGWPYSGEPQRLATYNPPPATYEQGAEYSLPMRGNYIQEPWNLGSEQLAASAQAPAVASASGTRVPTTFQQSLVDDYSSFATKLDEPQHQWADADYFSTKGLAAARAQAVLPEDNRNWLIPGQHRLMLADARVRLISDLDGGGRARAPALAARAQVSYDCWVEHMEKTWLTAENGACRKQFESALDQLEGRSVAQAATPGDEYRFQVYFDFDKSYLTAEAHQIVTSIVQRLQAEPGLRIALVGKADRSGTDPYNMSLSERRADTVQAELVKDGVAMSRIVSHWVGEREPPVATPDGVREPRNRVVEVTTHGPNQAISQR